MTAQMNGPADGGKYIDTIDPDDPEYVRQMRRPVDVKEDMRQMEERRRVSQIMSTKAFREELEVIIHELTEKAEPNSDSLAALQQISDLISPTPKSGGLFARGAGKIIPINDIRGVDSLNYTKGEKLMRCKVAGLYRLADVFGWGRGIHSCITCRLSMDYEHFMMSPHGMLYHEVSAGNLVKVDMQGEVVDAGSSNLGINKQAYAVHSTIHAARPDIKCIVHLYNNTSQAVSSMGTGLLPICPEALCFGEASTYDCYDGQLETQDDRDKLARSLGPNNKVLILQNYGIVVGGCNIDEAFYFATNIMIACEIQLRSIPIGMDKIQIPSEEEQQRMAESINKLPPGGEEGKRKWRRGEMEFEAYMRHLDNAGYRTGHIYREPIHRTDAKINRTNSEVEIPPSASNFAYYYDDDGKSPLKLHMDQHKKKFKSEWLNTPNAYKKEEIDEIGTPNPKKFTKWVSEDTSKAPTLANKITTENPNQFAPQGENPKEFREKHKAIKKEYYTEKIDAGPQSKILEGMTWEEAQKLKDGHFSGAGDTVVTVGAASKGIIQRDHQHNAVVYKTYYAPNPFDNMSAEEVEAYKHEVEDKTKGGAGEPVATEEALEPGPDGKLISTEERMQQIKQQEQQQQAYVRPGVVETNIDDIADGPPVPVSQHYQVAPQVAEQAQQKPRGPPPRPPPRADANSPIDVTPHRPLSMPVVDSPKKSVQLVEELESSFGHGRSKSERKPKKKKHRRRASDTAVNGDEAQPAGSPTKSTSSGEGTLDESSPTKETAPGLESPEKSEKKKKKFRIPSFSKTKKDKKHKHEKAEKQ